MQPAGRPATSTSCADHPPGPWLHLRHLGLGVFERIWQRIEHEGLIIEDGRDIRDMTDDEIMDWVVEQQHEARTDRPATPAVPDDPADDYLITLARTWDAALVTGDRHLLDLPGMPVIMRPATFLRLLA